MQISKSAARNDEIGSNWKEVGIAEDWLMIWHLIYVYK